MTQRSRITIIASTLTAIAVVGWFMLPKTTEPVFAEDTKTTNLSASGPLDGMTFAGALGQMGQPKDVKDTFVFANGTFVSKECESRCKYPARPYFVRNNGNKTEFVSETKCPYKDASIIWRGTIEGNSIKGVSTWTVRRWYWTVKNRFEFAGTLVNRSAPVSKTQ